MRAGRREKRSRYRGKETLPVPFALPSPGNQVPFEGTRAHREPPTLAQGLAAPCATGRRQGQRMLRTAVH